MNCKISFATMLFLLWAIIMPLPLAHSAETTIVYVNPEISPRTKEKYTGQKQDGDR